MHTENEAQADEVRAMEGQDADDRDLAAEEAHAEQDEEGPKGSASNPFTVGEFLRAVDVLLKPPTLPDVTTERVLSSMEESRRRVCQALDEASRLRLLVTTPQAKDLPAWMRSRVGDVIVQLSACEAAIADIERRIERDTQDLPF